MEKSVSKMKSTGFFLPVTVPTRAIAMAAIAIAGSAGRRIASQGGGLNPEGFRISSGNSVGGSIAIPIGFLTNHYSMDYPIFLVDLYTELSRQDISTHLSTEKTPPDVQNVTKLSMYRKVRRFWSLHAKKIELYTYSAKKYIKFGPAMYTVKST